MSSPQAEEAPGTRRKFVLYAAVGAAALIVLGATLAWQLQHRGFEAPDMRDPARITAGKVVYEQHCAACHGGALEGQPNWTSRRPDGRLPAPPHDDSGHTWHHPFEVLFALTKFGLVPPHAPANYASDMPGFGDRLSDEQIWNVLAYIRSRWSPKIQAAHDNIERRFREQSK